MKPASEAGALSGLRVLDFTQMMLGPLCTQTLADLGAEVIKVEKPGGGDWMRGMPMFGEYVGKDSAAFLSFNRNKKSVTVNIKNPHGRQLLLDIASHFDVVAENFRSGVMDRLGLGYADFKAARADIIYASGSGWGSGTKLAREGWPGQDLLVQAMSGVMCNTGRSGEQPTACGTPIADFAASQSMVSGILAALIARDRHGIGQHVEVDLFSSTLNAMAQENFAALNQEARFRRSETGIATPWNSAPYGPHPTSDGFVAIAMSPLDRLAELFSDPFFAKADGFTDRDAVKLRIDGHTRNMTTADLLNLLRGADLWCAPVQDSHQAMSSVKDSEPDLLITMNHAEAGAITAVACPIRLTGTPVKRSDAPPRVGEHTDQVLRDLVGPARLDELKSVGAVA